MRETPTEQLNRYWIRILQSIKARAESSAGTEVEPNLAPGPLAPQVGAKDGS
jgi:hypothetical protein